MFTRDRVHTSRERNIGRNNPDVHSVLAVFFQRNLAPADAGDGVSTYLALTFGTLLSSQGTDASFVLTLSGFPPGASLRSCVSDSIRSFRSDFLGAFQVPAFLSRFPFRRFRLYQKFWAGLTGRSFPIHRERLLGNRCSTEADRFSPARSDCVRLQATVRIYLPARAVSTAPAGRRGD